MPSNKKIIISCSSPESLINFRGRLIQELTKNNDVHVFTPAITNAHLLTELKNMSITVHENDLIRNGISIWSDLKYMLQLRKTIRNVKPDIFFSYTFKPVIFGSLTASLLNVKTIVAMLTGLGNSFTETPRYTLVGKITQQLLKLSLRSSKRIKIILQNKDDCCELLERGIINKKSKYFVVNGSGVDLTKYQYSVPDVRKISFLMMARLINAKGVVEYYRAAKNLKDKYPAVDFLLTGTYDRKDLDRIDEDVYVNIMTSNAIQYQGWTNDVRPLIEASSVVVLPSFYREGIPRSIQEGMAMGRAVITTDAIGCRETIKIDTNHPNGFAIPVKNAEALESKMEFFIVNPEKIVDYGVNGRKFCEERFDVEKINKHMIDILDRE